MVPKQGRTATKIPKCPGKARKDPGRHVPLLEIWMVHRNKIYKNKNDKNKNANWLAPELQTADSATLSHSGQRTGGLADSDWRTESHMIKPHCTAIVQLLASAHSAAAGL